MKTTAILLFALFFSPFFLSNSFDPEEGLIAYYSFNECDARDDTGNGSDGKLFGSVSCWCGIDDEGLLLNGINDYVEFHGPVNDYFSTSDFTISFYFKSDQYSIQKQSMIAKREVCDEIQMLDIMADRANGIIDTDVHENDQKDYPGLSPSFDGAGWHHFALVRRGIRAYTYINGQLIKESRRCSGIDISNNAVLSFSNSPCMGYSVKRFKGIIDEVRVYDYALRAEQVQELYALFPVESAETDCVM